MVEGHIDRLTSRSHFSHGHFPPKNVLVGDGGLWVIDFEIAAIDLAVDLTFLLSHLLLKSLHRPARTECYSACADAFITSYSTAAIPALAPAWECLAGHVGGLLLAPVDGESPGECSLPHNADQPVGWALPYSSIHPSPAPVMD